MHQTIPSHTFSRAVCLAPSVAKIVLCKHYLSGILPVSDCQVSVLSQQCSNSNQVLKTCFTPLASVCMYRSIHISVGCEASDITLVHTSHGNCIHVFQQLKRCQSFLHSFQFKCETSVTFFSYKNSTPFS